MVYVVATATDAIVDSIRVGSVPTDVKISPDGRYAYVAVTDADSFAVVSVPDRSLLVVRPVADSPRGVALSPDGSRVFVSNYYSNCITEFLPLPCDTTPLLPCPYVEEDVNGDGIVNVQDVVQAVNVAFQGGAATAPRCAWK